MYLLLSGGFTTKQGDFATDCKYVQLAAEVTGSPRVDILLTVTGME